MCQNLNENFLAGQNVQWRMHKNDSWKTAAVTGREDYSIITFGEYREENVFFFQQSKVLLEHADLEYIYCTADDGSRFRGYAILGATLYPMQQSQQPQWYEPKCSVSDIPVAVMHDHVYVIDQFKKSGDESEFSRERPDLTPALAIMFQMQ